MNRLNKSVISGVNSHAAAAMDDSISVHGGYFPFKLTATLAALKIVGGCMLIGLGAAAMVQKAAYADTAAGIWSGVIVIISGVLGAYTVRTNALRLYVITFLVASLVSLLSSVLLIIYSATGLAKDANLPFGVTVSDNGEVVDVVENDVQLSVSNRESAMLINTLLIILGFLDIVFGIPSTIICLREICHCYDPTMFPRYSVVGKERLMNWLGGSRPVFYSQSSGIPYGKLRGSALHPMYAGASPPFIHVPSDPFMPSSDPSHSMPSSRHSPRDSNVRHSRTRSKSPNPRHVHSTRLPASVHAHHGPPSVHPSQAAYPSAYPPMEMFTPYYLPPGPGYPPGPAYAPSHMSPPSHASHPAFQQQILGFPHPGMMMGGGAPTTWFYPPPDWESIYQDQSREERRHQREHHHQHQRDQHKRSRSRSKSAARDGTSRKKKRSPTNSDIDRTYTGMDRELAEEFIEQTMEPGNTTVDQTMSATESEAW